MSKSATARKETARRLAEWDRYKSQLEPFFLIHKNTKYHFTLERRGTILEVHPTTQTIIVTKTQAKFRYRTTVELGTLLMDLTD